MAAHCYSQRKENGWMTDRPKEIAEAIRQRVPEFVINYKPDYRQQIAESWPQSIDDSFARNDWGWHQEYDLQKMADDMLKNLQGKY